MILLIYFIFLAFKEFSAQCFDRAYENSKRRLAEVSAQNTDAMRIEFQRAKESVIGSAAALSLLDDPQSDAAMRYLKTVQDVSNFSRMWIIDREGIAQNSAGESFDVSMRQYVHFAEKGMTGIACVSKSFFSDTPIFCVFAPITHDDAYNGVVLGIFELESLIVKAENPQFGGKGYVQVFDNRGDTVIRSQHENALIDTDNIFSFLRAADLGRHDYDEFRSTVAAGGHGVLTYTYKGQERMGYYGPIGTNDWIIFSSAPPGTSSFR